MRADGDHSRQAVMLQIHLLEQLELADRTFHTDGQIALAYVRLAMIEEAAGQLDAQRSALAQARAHFRQIHSPTAESTDDELKNAVQRLDRASDNL